MEDSELEAIRQRLQKLREKLEETVAELRDFEQIVLCKIHQREKEPPA